MLTQDDIAPREAPAAARSWAREPGVHRGSRALRSGQIADLATFEDPHRFCAGVIDVVVNGHLVIEHGQDTGASAGRVLRRTDHQG